MKKFFVMILCVSTFFIGLGNLVERAGAKYNSDARALELIRLARIAVGGDVNLRNVRSMTINGRAAHVFEKDGVQNEQQGTLEINLQFPGQFSKMLKFGNPDGNAADGDIVKDVDIIVMRKGEGETEITSDSDSKIIVRKGDGLEKVWIDENGGRTDLEGEKIVIKKDDGTVEELKGDGKHKFIFRGAVEGGVRNTDDDQRIIIKKGSEFTTSTHQRSNEMLRTTMALLLTAPEGLDVVYKYAGEGDVDGSPSNIIEVSDGGSAFKLYLDKTTNLPQMISFEGINHAHMIRIHKRDGNAALEGDIAKMKTESAEAKPVEHQVRFSDFRSVDGLLLPHRWTESAGEKQLQSVDVTGYQINPANIAEKFEGQKGQTIFIRKAKPMN